MNYSRKIVSRLESVRHIIVDMDGTIYEGNRLFSFTIDFFETLKNLSISHTYLTNNSSQSVIQYRDKLHRLGLKASKEDIYTSALATVGYLKSEKPGISKLFILGTDGLKTEFRDAGFLIVKDDSADEPDAVIVGFDTSLVFGNLCKAAYWIKLGKPFIATHPDLICPTNQPTLLVDCGAISAALESATGRAPDIVLGKPDPGMIFGILERNHFQKNEVAVVGDRLYTDIKMADNAGVLGILVLSGETTEKDLESSLLQPDLVVENIRELGNLLAKSRSSR